jgi:hypothetical protein
VINMGLKLYNTVPIRIKKLKKFKNFKIKLGFFLIKSLLLLVGVLLF